MDLDDPWAEAPSPPDDDPGAEAPSPPTDAMGAVEEPTLHDKDALAPVEELFGGEAAALARAAKLLNELFGEVPSVLPVRVQGLTGIHGGAPADRRGDPRRCPGRS
jgi:hypothetical protein